MRQVFPAILHFGGDDMAKKHHDCTELLTLARSLVDHNCSYFRRDGMWVSIYYVCSTFAVTDSIDFFEQHPDLGVCFARDDFIEFQLYSVYGAKRLMLYLNQCLEDRRH